MRIVEVRERAVPLIANIKNSVVNFADHTVSLVAVISDVVRNGHPVAGIAFDSIGRYAQSGLLRERFFPRLMNAQPEELLAENGTSFDSEKVWKILMRNEKPGGHGDRAHAVAAVELAFWDLQAKLLDVPAWQLIADHFGQDATPEIPVYAAGGYYYPEDSHTRLQEEMRRYRDLGYRCFKMKIGGASLDEDRRRIDAVLEVFKDPSVLAVDANGRFDTPTALAYGRALRDLGLRWYEEPGDPLDYALMNELAVVYPHALATGENLFSYRDVKNLIKFSGMRSNLDIFQMDPGLSYGLSEFVRMIDAMEAAAYSRRALCPHGGHMIALHVAAGLGLGGSEAYPGVFAPIGGYAPDCTIGDHGVSLGATPGFGLETKPDLGPLIHELLS